MNTKTSKNKNHNHFLLQNYSKNVYELHKEKDLLIYFHQGRTYYVSTGIKVKKPEF